MSEYLTDISIDRYVDQLIRLNGKVHPVARDKGTSKTHLPALHLLDDSNRHLFQPDDSCAFSGQLSEQLRIVPEVVFEARRASILPGGFVAVDDKTTGRLMRSKKFLYRNQNFLQTTENRSIKQNLCFSESAPPPLLIGPLEEFNYSHWIFEGLPKLGLYRKAYNQWPEQILICGKSMDFHVQSIRFLGLEADIRYIKKFPTEVSHVAYTTSLARSVSEINPYVIDFYNGITFNSDRIDTKKRIYISRRNAGHRRVQNESEIVNLVQSHGFSVVDPGGMPFSDQFEIFRNVEAIISPHGAGLTNMIFSKNLKGVVELHSSGFKDESAYSHICRHLRGYYLALSGMPIGKVDETSTFPSCWPGHMDFTVDMGLFENALNLLAARLEPAVN